MAKRTAFLHVGLPHGGGAFLSPALTAHADALTTYGVRQPARSEDEMFRAAVEIRRDHRSWGLRRKDVEGVWSSICRRAYTGKDTVVFSHDLLAAASPAEIALLADRLPGFALHVVVTAGVPDARVSLFPDDHDLGDVLERWSAVVRSTDRVHVVVTDPADRGSTWDAFGRVVGFDVHDLPLTDAHVTPRHDTGTLRLMAESAGDLATREQLVAVVEGWSKGIAEKGYDVHGDLAALAPSAGAVPGTADETEPPDGDQVAALSAALGDTLAEVTRLRQHAAQLEESNARLARKRVKLKRRLAEAVAGSSRSAGE